MLIAVFVLVTIIVAVFPVTIVTVMFTVFVPLSFFAATTDHRAIDNRDARTIRDRVRPVW
jgi:hypothetical protein